MNNVRIKEVKRSILEDNDADAAELRQELKEQDIFYINLMSAPGSGKTTFLCQLIDRLNSKIPIGVMEADIDSDVDAHTIQAHGAESIQLHTGGMCHLDADMSRQGFMELQTHAKMVFLENVGNLVCPAEYDTGAACKIMLLSVPEGDDKPIKYPLMFSCVDAVFINKMDTLAYFDFDLEACKEAIRKRNPKVAIFTGSAKTGEGMAEVEAWLLKQFQQWGQA